MHQIITAITALVAKITGPKSAAPLKDRVKVLVREIGAEATASYAKAGALSELAGEIALRAKHERNYATEVNSLAGRLEKAID